jgi:hypothetical protein
MAEPSEHLLTIRAPIFHFFVKEAHFCRKTAGTPLETTPSSILIVWLGRLFSSRESPAPYCICTAQPQRNYQAGSWSIFPLIIIKRGSLLKTQPGWMYITPFENVADSPHTLAKERALLELLSGAGCANLYSRCEDSLKSLHAPSLRSPHVLSNCSFVKIVRLACNSAKNSPCAGLSNSNRIRFPPASVWVGQSVDELLMLKP